MNAETGSGTPSWEEWVEQLTQLSEQEQLTSLLNKAKELKDRSSTLEDIIRTKEKEISDLNARIRQDLKEKRESDIRAEKKAAMTKRCVEKKISRQLEDKYEEQIHKLSRMFYAALIGCLLLVIALASKSPEYVRDVAVLSDNIIIGYKNGVALCRDGIQALMSAVKTVIDNHVLCLCIETMAVLLVYLLVGALIGGVAFLIIRLIRKCWRKSASILIVGGISAFALPTVFCSLLEMLGINACIVSGILVLLIMVVLLIHKGV